MVRSAHIPAGSGVTGRAFTTTSSLISFRLENEA